MNTNQKLLTVIALIVLLISSWGPMAKTEPQAIYDSLWLIVLWMPLGAIGEEIGWRGYLNKMLDGRLRGLVSSLLVGVLWMPIHVSFLSEGPVFIFFLTLLIISYSVVNLRIGTGYRFQCDTGIYLPPVDQPHQPALPGCDL